MVFARKVNETSSTARSPPNSLTSWLISSMLPVLQHSTAGLLDFLFKRRNLVDGNHACGLHVAVDDRPDHHGRVDIAIFIDLKRTRCTHILHGFLLRALVGRLLQLIDPGIDLLAFGIGYLADDVANGRGIITLGLLPAPAAAHRPS